MAMSPMQERALLKRVEALEALVQQLVQHQPNIEGFLAAFGDRTTASELRSKLALAWASGAPETADLLRQWSEFSAQMAKKYPGLKP